MSLFGWEVLLCFLIELTTGQIITVHGTVGQTGTIVCPLQGVITWKGPPKLVVYSWKDQLNLPEIPEERRNRIRVTGDPINGHFNLQISQIQVGDSGNYSCVLDKGTTQKFRFVVGYITVHIPRPIYSGKEAQSVTLVCLIQSVDSGVQSVTWSRCDSLPLKPGDKYMNGDVINPNLTIASLHKEDEGLYCCKGTDDANNSNSSRTTLTVESLPPKKDTNNNDSMVILYIVVGVVVAALLVTFLLGVHMKKTKPLFLQRLAYSLQKFEDDDEKTYDAFVSFKSAERDTEFVCHHLYQRLEEELGFKLCIHTKDFVPGHTIFKNIADAINDSRRSILVISKTYLEAGYTTVEYEMAHTEMINSKHRIIPILLEPIEVLEANMDDTMKNIMKSVTYITWPGTTNQKALTTFWKRLELSMPKKTRSRQSENNERISLLTSSQTMAKQFL